MNIRSLARKPFFDFFFLSPMMPQMLRMALSDSLTYSPNQENTGPRAHFNFSKFRKQKVNSGLNKTFKAIQEIKEEGNHITERLSVSDLIQIGGAAAVEYCGGPYIELKVGRVDIEDEHFAAEHTLFPELDIDAAEIRAKYAHIGLNDELTVALFGHRTLGFVSNKESDKDQRWSRNPWVFDNNYFQELLNKEILYVRTPSDLALLNDEGFRHHVESFANNQTLFFDSFVAAYQRLSELGNDKLLEENKSHVKQLV